MKYSLSASPMFGRMEGLTLAALERLAWPKVERSKSENEEQDRNSHPREVGTHADEDGNNRTPVGAIFVVPIPSVSAIQTGHVVLLSLHNPVIGTEESSDGGEEDTETGHERQQRLGRVDDLPRLHDPSGRDGGDNDAATDVDVLGEQAANVIGAADDVGRQVGTDLSHDPAKTNKEGAASTSRSIPMRGNLKRVPDVLAIDNLGCRAADDAKEAEHQLDARKKGNLPVDTLVGLEVSGKVGNVGGHGCPGIVSRCLARRPGADRDLPATSDTGQG